jgi:hypothetical protein
MKCAAIIKKKEALAREYGQLKNISLKLEELCRDFSNKNKLIEVILLIRMKTKHYRQKKRQSEWNS